MANSGRGSVKKLPNGRYKARIRPPGGKEISRTFDLKRQADEWLDEQRTQMAAGKWYDPKKGRMLFGEWVDQWHNGLVHLKPGTAERYQARINVHLLPTFEDRPIDSITKPDVQKWVAGLTGTLAPSTVHLVYGTLASIFHAAVREPVLPFTPCRDINLPQIPETEAAVPTVRQLEVMQPQLPAPYRRMVSTCAGSGLRLGETIGLTVDRIDFREREILVDRQLPFDNTARFVPPKNNRVRRVPIGAHTAAVLRAQLDEFPPVEVPGLGLIVFRTTRDTYIRRQIWQQAWAGARRRVTKALAKPGAEVLPPLDGLTFHGARHFYASLLISQGLSATAVAKMLGHKDASVTLRVYAHLWPNDGDRVRDAVDAVLLDDDDFHEINKPDETDEGGGIAAEGGGGP